MATILAHITVIAGCEERFEAIAEDLFRASHAHEQGLLRYEYWRGADPQTYYTLLSFTDFSAFIAHQTSEHHETASPLIGAVVADLRLEWVDPVQGASELPSTDAQDLSASLDKLTQVYAKRFRAEIAPWWLPLRREIS
ncbi:MAG: hypothetical protein RL688_345 [Actinomycetota bacterium]|jgi:quinol monooxygenase YgiN